MMLFLLVLIKHMYSSWSLFSSAESAIPTEDFSVGSFYDGSTMPYPRVHSCYVSSGDKIYQFGGMKMGKFGMNGLDEAGRTMHLTNSLWKLDTQSFEWTYIRGTNQTNVLSVYDNLTNFSEDNEISSRMGSTCWIGNNGNLYIFGGSGHVYYLEYTLTKEPKNYGCLNDMFEVDLGSPERTKLNLYGTEINEGIGEVLYDYNVEVYDDTTGATNRPIGKAFSSTWVTDDEIIIFGGIYDSQVSLYYYEDSSTVASIKNDIWSWDKTSLTFSRLMEESGCPTRVDDKFYENLFYDDLKPFCVFGATTWTEGDVHYLFGGIYEDSNFGGKIRQASNTLFKYKTPNLWGYMNGPRSLHGETEYEGYGSDTLPGARGFSLSWSTDNSILLFGGWGRGRTNSSVNSTYTEMGGLGDYYIYNKKKNEWEYKGGSLYSNYIIPEMENGDFPYSRWGGYGFKNEDSEIIMFGGAVERTRTIVNETYTTTTYLVLGDFWIEEPVCEGLSYSSSEVCSKKGTCISDDFCECVSGSFGNNCQETISSESTMDGLLIYVRYSIPKDDLPSYNETCDGLIEDTNDILGSGKTCKFYEDSSDTSLYDRLIIKVSHSSDVENNDEFVVYSQLSPGESVVCVVKEDIDDPDDDIDDKDDTEDTDDDDDDKTTSNLGEIWWVFVVGFGCILIIIVVVVLFVVFFILILVLLRMKKNDTDVEMKGDSEGEAEEESEETDGETDEEEEDEKKKKKKKKKQKKPEEKGDEDEDEVYASSSESDKEI